MISQAYACSVVRKYINSIIKLTLDFEKERVACGSGCWKSCSWSVPLMSWGEGHLKLDVKLQHQVWVGVAQYAQEAEGAGTFLRRVHECVLCVPKQLGSAGCSFLCSPSISHYWNYMWKNVKLALCAQTVLQYISAVRTNLCVWNKHCSRTDFFHC